MLRPAKEKYKTRHLVTIPTIYIIVAFFLAFSVPRINFLFYPWLVSPLRSEIIIPILSSITSGMIAFTGIVFSLLFVIIQFQSSAYSPRLVNALQKDISPNAIGIFIGTFIYTLISMRVVNPQQSTGSSTLMLWVALAWLLASMFMLVLFVVRIGDLQIERVLYSLGASGDSAVDHLCDRYKTFLPMATFNNLNKKPEGHASQEVLYNGPPKYLLTLNISKLIKTAVKFNAVILVPKFVGDPVIENDRLLMVYSNCKIPEKVLKPLVVMGWRRLLRNNPGYVLRLLVDIAIRALSPAVNDPTTAVQVIDQIQSLLIRIGNATLDIGQIRDSSGTVRLILSTPSWEDYLELSLAEIMHYGASSLQIQRRIGTTLNFLKVNLPAHRHKAIELFEAMRFEDIKNAFSAGTFRDKASRCDSQGIGYTKK